MSSLLDRLMVHGKSVFLVYDEGLEGGPMGFNEDSVNPGFALKVAAEGGCQGVVLHKGFAERYYGNLSEGLQAPLIMKLNGRTSLRKDHDVYAPQVTTVEEAVHLGAEAVAYSLYFGSKYEPLMFKEFGKIVREARRFDVPIMVFAYAKGRDVVSEFSPEAVSYATRAAVELGADMVLAQWPGSAKALQVVVQAAAGVPVILAGAEKVHERHLFKLVKDALHAGAAGVTVGRNCTHSTNPTRFLNDLIKIVCRAES